jgi:hypothetical protein
MNKRGPRTEPWGIFNIKAARLLARITDILLSVLQVAFEPVQSNSTYTVKFEFR